MALPRRFRVALLLALVAAASLQLDAQVSYDRILKAAGIMLPADLRCLDAIHIATAHAVGSDLGQICTYDELLAAAAKASGLAVVAPT